MLIAQLTDIHIGFDRAAGDEEPNLQRLGAVVRRLVTGPNRPDLVLLSGDLTEHGDTSSFARLRAALAPLGVPCLPIPGNHDRRDELVAAFAPVERIAGGFVQYCVDAQGLRLVMLDTVEDCRHGGAFCQVRADWLASQLAAHPATPTLVVMHHPPFPSGVAWMDTDPAEPWVGRLAAALSGHDQIVGIACGHLHRAMIARWAGLPAFVCPSTAPPVALDLNPIDPERPDGRALISAEPPGYGLHHWDGTRLVSHFELLAGVEPIARFDAGLQGMVRAMLAERPQP